jgi:hypothetical protein
MRYLIPALLALAACAELPPAQGTISQAAREAPPPRLVPVGPILAEGMRPSAARAEGPDLAARGAALSRRTVASPPGPSLTDRGEALRREADALSGIGSPDDLDARATELDARAEALRSAPL